MNMQGSWSFTCCFTWTLGSSLKCGQPVFSIGIILVDVLQNCLSWFHFLLLEGGLLIILIDCMIFLSPFVDVTRMSMSTVSFRTQLDWNSLPIECFLFAYNLNRFKSRINSHLATNSFLILWKTSTKGRNKIKLSDSAPAGQQALSEKEAGKKKIPSVLRRET